MRTNALGATAHFSLPVDQPGRVERVTWAGQALDGGELAVFFRPHPQKGKGTTPMIDFDDAGNLAIKGCGSPVPSL